MTGTFDVLLKINFNFKWLYVQLKFVPLLSPSFLCPWGRREGAIEGGRDRGREGSREGGIDGGREGGWEGETPCMHNYYGS